VSLFFHWLDVNDYFAKYRLHTPAELSKRNRVTRWEVVRDVIVQQIIQTLFGLILAVVDEGGHTGKEEYDTMVWATRIRVAERFIPRVLSLVGFDPVGLAARMSSYPMLAAAILGGKYSFLTQEILSDTGVPTTVPAFANWELTLGGLMYWYLVPAFQFFYCIFFLDTWQYFLHRAMHMNKWLYSKSIYPFRV
jgi:sphinganine C4-monooxygenase